MKTHGEDTGFRSSTEIADEILRRIKSGHYRPGDTLSQNSLAKEFSISRTPVREALRFLEAKRAISVTSSGRAKIVVPNLREIKEAFEIRAELEGLAARLAVDWITDEDLTALRFHQKNYARTLIVHDPDAKDIDWVLHNARFHDVICDACHNEMLKDLVSEMQGNVVSRVMSLASRMPPRLLDENVQQHEDIIAALSARDHERAGKAMKDHVLRTRALVIEWVGAGS
ncbi:HTH-type transcriptional repressor CsiR [Oceanibacterium hippocampi]|uniref:HTH-type transcriptional repressor CsiR n=2 Tax=Oceanibacterium hippocampi TaxID=745714 RepID=A0A1Y5TM95_9PROT|nr:HTH-type transcriptional repressor CsiR [Oceanibacterium hippocampi]